MRRNADDVFTCSLLQTSISDRVRLLQPRLYFAASFLALALRLRNRDESDEQRKTRALSSVIVSSSRKVEIDFAVQQKSFSR